MRVVITGASGFIGKPLTESLSELGHDVLAIARKIPKSSNSTKIFWLEADLSSSSTYKNSIKEFYPEVIIHLAWQDIPDFSLEKSQLNLNQSKEFLSFIASIKSCKKLLIPGSCLEYSNPKGECLETDQALPSNDFTRAKHSLRLWVELLCNEESISLAWFRVFYVYGPGQRTESLIPTILTQLKKGRLPNINTPQNSNDFVFIDDVVNAFIIATNTRFVSGIYNLGSGMSTSVLDVCRYAEEIVLNSTALSESLEAESQAKSLNMNFWAGIAATKKSFNWSPKINILDGIKQTWKNINNP